MGEGLFQLKIMGKYVHVDFLILYMCIVVITYNMVCNRKVTNLQFALVNAEDSHQFV